MVVFSSLDQAVREGFLWVEFQKHTGLHLVCRTFQRRDGKLVRAMAYARPHPDAP